jgi:hypothetical protein
MSWCCWTFVDDWCCSTTLDEMVLFKIYWWVGLEAFQADLELGYWTLGDKVLMINRADVDELMRWVYVIYVRVIYSCPGTILHELMVMSCGFWNTGDELMLLNCGDKLMSLNFWWRYDTNELMSRNGVVELIFLNSWWWDSVVLGLMNWYWW